MVGYKLYAHRFMTSSKMANFGPFVNLGIGIGIGNGTGIGTDITNAIIFSSIRPMDPKLSSVVT